MRGSSSKGKPKPSEVAAETKKTYIPLIRHRYGHVYKTSSVLFPRPLEELDLSGHLRPFGPTKFYVRQGDPVVRTLEWAASLTTHCGEPVAVAFICAAYDKRPGGDWETEAGSYEEQLCRRSSLSATLATPAPETYAQTNYPIPIEGGILSEEVVVFRGPHDRYEKLASTDWGALTVCSVPPMRWPKLTQDGTKYSFAVERDMAKNKLRSALRICVHRGYAHVVVGDFGLGKSYCNPPQELAELWREVCLRDPDLRGRLQAVTFVFEDPAQSTAGLILEKQRKRAVMHSSAYLPSVPSSAPTTDFGIFQQVFSDEEMAGFLAVLDSRYELDMPGSPVRI